jgi:hypothetical protein
MNPQFMHYNTKHRGITRPKGAVNDVCPDCGDFVKDGEKHTCPDHEWNNAWDAFQRVEKA